MQMFDLHTVTLIFAAALAGGVVGLDRTAAGQFMISQPIVAGPLTGWLLGDTTSGAVIGAVLELIWVLDMPVGTFVPADATIGTVSATAIAVLGSTGKTGLDVIGFSLLLTTGMVPITMAVDDFVRKGNSRLAEAALSASGEDAGAGLSRAHLSGLIVFFLKSFALCLFFIPAGLAAVSFFSRLPEQAHAAMALFVKLLPMLGAALVLHKLSITVLNRFLIIGFASAAALTLLLPGHPLAIIVLVIAAGFLAARISDRT
jgi:mannose/fructose/N-acetylgalactosamine-specific phosphotransferase system component IIC